MDQPIIQDLEGTINPDAKPCYCSVVLQRAREVTVEGWLLQTNAPLYLIIQPSVVYEPGGMKLVFHFDEVLSIMPTYPPEPFKAQLMTPADADSMISGVLTDLATGFHQSFRDC